VRTHELLDSDSSDEESAADLEVNMHNFRAKIQCPLEFSDSEDEAEQVPNQTSASEEAMAIDAGDKIDDSDMLEDQSIGQKETAKMFEGMLHFSDSEDEDEAKFQLQACGFTSSIEEKVNANGTDAFEGSGDEGVIGEQEGNVSGLTKLLTNSDTDRCRLVDEFCSQDGTMHFRTVMTSATPKTKAKSFSKRRPRSGLTRKRPK